MCGVCGLLDSGAQWSDPLQNTLPRRQLRLQQMAMLNHALAPFRLKLTDFHTSWVLASPTGQQVIVNSLEQIWQEAEALLKRPLDPLDDDWLDALEQTR
jgi:hypothetical protein